MTRYLLAAEANKIQDLLFRSSRLREVAGGSELLTNFCRTMPSALGAPTGDIVTSDGGSFRILFDTPEQAKQFGAQLAEAYRRTTGGTLAVAEPVEYHKHDWETASENADKALRHAKRSQTSGETQEHAPYMAFCVSCGIGLAVTYTAYHRDENKQYLCQSCLNKSGGLGATPEFIENFYRLVSNGDYTQPEGTELEAIARYDPRGYVAYLVADGNNMGRVFGACNLPEKTRKLSQGLLGSVSQALAQPTRLLLQNNPHKDHHDFIPVYPLILGGDDVFVLLPAPWALDFAAQFCRAYEEEMKKLFKDIGLEDVPLPTMAASVVICKSKHPYMLAHEAGKGRLKAAKRMSKQFAQNNPPSSINFEVVLGGRLVNDDDEAGKFRPTLRPYWVNETPDTVHLSIQKLIAQRQELNTIPRKRLVELRELFDNPPSSTAQEAIEAWNTRQKALLRRLEVTNPISKEIVQKAFETLGGTEFNHWRRIDSFDAYGHGLPDLLQAWDFALDLGKTPNHYQEPDA